MKLALQNQLAISNQLQQENEKAIAVSASKRAERNTDELNRSIPNLADFISNYSLRNHSLFVNKDKSVNILIKSESLLVYPVDAEAFVSNQVTTFISDLSQNQHTNTATEKCLVIIGVGLGLHLLKLVEAIEPDYLVIYEPEQDFLKLSLYTAPWFELLTLCNIKKIQIFIQHGKNSQDLASDIQELKQAFLNIGKFYFCRHFAYPVLDKQLSQLGVIQAIPPTAYDLHPYLLPSAEVPEARHIINLEQQQIFEKNLQFFQKNHADLIISLEKELPQLFNSSHKQQCHLEKNSQIFHCSSNSLSEEKFLILKDPLVYGLSLSKNNSDIAFLGFINKLKSLLNTELTAETEFNIHFSEIILLGVLNTDACLSAARYSDRLLVIEECLSRFVQSCFTVKWYEFKSTKSFYFLIGSDASLERIEKMYKSGPLDFIDSYIFQPYFTVGHRKLSKDLLESIQSTNGKSNHFEARFNQLYRSFQNCRTYPILCPNLNLTSSLPVIIVGNGPSLELSLALLKTLRQRAILVSCGTALATLLNNNIRPDYHVELEKESDTLVRLKQLPANELKRISLLATVDVHSSISELFKQALLIATGANPVTELLYRSNRLCIPTLDYSYYTVTNFALELLLTLHFPEIFLVGVDFGFENIDSHHARSSNYFNEQGKSAYDYELQHGASFEVKANLDGSCLTVPAFNAARLLMQQCLANKAGNSKVYNIGHGAKIDGAQPLPCLPENIFHSTQPILLDNLVIEQHFRQLTAIDTSILINDTLVLANEFCCSLLALWSPDEEAPISEPQQLLLLLSKQKQLLETLKLKSEVVFDLFNGSCRYFSMLCHRYVKSETAEQLIRGFTENWFLLLQNYSTQLREALKP